MIGCRFQGHQVIVDFAAPKSKSSSGSLANSGACLSRKDSKVRTGKRGKEMEETVAAAKRGEIGRVEGEMMLIGGCAKEEILLIVQICMSVSLTSWSACCFILTLPILCANCV